MSPHNSDRDNNLQCKESYKISGTLFKNEPDVQTHVKEAKNVISYSMS